MKPLLSAIFLSRDFYSDNNRGSHIKSPVELVSLNDVFKETDAILLVTDHDVFSSINFSNIKKQIRTPLIIDGRNFFSRTQLEKLGFTYRAIGKP